MTMLRRLATPDTLLVAVASAIIVFSLRGEGEFKQSIHVSASDGQIHEYVLPVNDPTLQKLKSRYAKTKPYLPPAPLAIARWNHELASFYSKELEPTAESPDDPKSGFVVPVAYHDADRHQKPTESGNADLVDASDPASRLYWLAAKDRAERTIEVVEQRIAEQKALNPPRVVFGAVYQDQRLQLAFVFSCLGGLLLACGYAQWRQQSPRFQLPTSSLDANDVHLSLEMEPASLDAGTQPELDVPRDWIRVRQPAQVKLRRASVAALVAWALMTIVR